jgi:hypothetical protein
MTLRELKTSIQTQNIPDTFMIFLCADNYFLANQYIQAICDIKQLEKHVAESIFEQESALSLVMGFENDLRVIYTDVFEEASQDYSRFENTIVVCNKIDKKLEKLVAEFVINIPVLQAWQVKSYIRQQCPDITEQAVEDIMKATRGEINRVDNLISKVKLFEPYLQNQLVFELVQEPGTFYFDYAEMDDFKLTDAILRNNREEVKKCIRAGRLTGPEFLSYAGRLLNKVKSIILAEHTNLPGSEFGITDKQCNFMRFNRSSFTIPELQAKLDTLSSLDLKLKSGLLDMDSDCQMSYLLMRLMHG